MTRRFTIALRADVAAPGLDTRALRALARRALASERVDPPAELSIVLAGDAAVRALNREYRKTDRPTDVLSFAQSEGEPFARPEREARHLGDVIISVDTAGRRAAEQGIDVEDEVEHLLVHGILHLLGHDHETAAEAAIMRSHEDAILGRAHHD